MLLCSGCDRTFHLACLQPPLAAAPASGPWTCSAACARSLGSGTAAVKVEPAPVKAEPAAAVKPEPGSQRLGAGSRRPAAKRRAGHVGWSSSEDDSEDEGRGVKAGEVRGRWGTCVIS